MTLAPPDLSPRQPADARRFARVIPLAFITYSLAFLDRTNYGWGAQGMSQDLHISASAKNWVAAMFFVGYTLFQIPGAAYASHRSVRKLIFWALILWGLFSSLTGVVRSVPALLTVRCLLGVVEGVVYPSMLIYLNHWFSKREKSRANAFLILGNALTMTWGMALSGFLVGTFDKHPVMGLKGWQMMFILEGIPSILWAFVWWFLAADRPADAGWLSPQEAGAVQAMLDEEQRGIPPVKDYFTAFTDRRVLLICCQFFFWSAGLYGIAIWLPQVVLAGAKQSMGTTGLLTSIPYFCAIVAMMSVSWLSDWTLKRKAFIAPCLAVGTAGFVLTCLAGPDRFPLAFAGIIIAVAFIYAAYGPFWSILPEMIPRNVAGESTALINSAGALGGFAGTYVVGWLNGSNTTSTPAFVFLAACLAAAALLILPVNPAARQPAGGFEVVTSKA